MTLKDWIDVGIILWLLISVYYWGRSAGKRAAWRDAEAIGTRVAERMKAHGIKVIDDEEAKAISRFESYMPGAHDKFN